MSIEIPLQDQLTVEQAIAAANAAKRGAQQALAGIPAAIDAEVGPAAAPYITQASNAKDAALVAQAAAEAARDNALAAERRIRQQSLGTFADDAAAVAWAAAQTPPITIVTGTSYLNSTTDVFRYAVVSAGPTITWHDVTEDEAAQAALASASAAAAAAVQADLNTRFLPAASTDWTFVGPSAPWAVGCRYRNTLLGVDKVWTGSAWERYDKTAQDASSAATGAADTATTQAGIATTKAGDATSAKTASEAARDVAIGARDAAAGSATAAGNSKAAVDASLLQAISFAALAQAGAASVSAQQGLSILAAAQRAIALMTDGAATFWYDTRKDSDGGAWVDKCVSQSMILETLNTATRGATAKYPKSMLLVGRNSATGNPAFTIYDGSDPTLPMWGVFIGATANLLDIGSSNNINGISALNGVIYIAQGGSWGATALDLISDTATNWFVGGREVWTAGGLSTRNAASTSWVVNAAGGYALASSNCNSIAATIAPNTPLNPLRCNLPNPTVAVATTSGVSVIRSDGVVSNSQAGTFIGCAFDANGTLAAIASAAAYFWQPANFLQNGFSWSTPFVSFTSAQLGVGNLSKVTACGQGLFAYAGASGLARIKLDPTNPANSLINVKTTTYDTGWMVLGKTVLAMAESSQLLTAMTETALVSDDFGSYADTTALQAVWGTNTNATVALNAGKMRVTKTAATSVASQTATSLPLVSGRYFRVEYDYNVISSTGNVTLYGAIAGALIGAGVTVAAGASGRYVGYVIATSTTNSRVGMGATVSTDAVIDVDNLAVYQVQAADWSGSGNHMKATGSPTRAVVATGADTAGVGGFGAGAYLEGPNVLNGLTDCAIRLKWGMGTMNAAEGPIGWGDTSAYSSDVACIRYTAGALYATVKRGGSLVNASFTMTRAAATIFRAAWLVCRGTRLELWLDRALVATATISASAFSNGAAVSRVGCDVGGNWAGGSIALAQFLSYAPTPDQIAFMDSDELPRFNANAQSLLTGANVQGVAWCPDTDQVAAANSTGGCDVFKGSVRMANDNSTLAINRVRNSALTGISVGAIAGGYIDSGGSLPISVGGGLSKSVTAVGNGWFDIRINGTANAAGYFSIAPLLYTAATAANGQSWTAAMQLALVAGSWANVSSPAMLLSEMSSGGSGLASSNTSLSGLNSTLALKTVSRTFNQASAATAYVHLEGTFANGAVIDFTIRIYQPFLAQVASFTAFSDGLSNSANAKAVAMAQGKVAVITAAGVDVWIPAAPGQRETAEGVGASKRAVYDPSWGQYFGVTTDATPTVFASIPIPEGKAFRFRATVVAVMYGGTATEKAVYDITGVVSRDIGGNVVVVSTTNTISEVTSTMDCVAQANTTAQTLEIKATGKAATRIAWFDGQELYDVGLMAAA